MLQRLKRLLADDRGATAVEYGLICALIVIAMVSALISVASVNTEIWNNVSSKIIKAS